MQQVTIDRLEDDRDRDGVALARLGPALGADHVAVNRYRVPPGERISGLHAHGDQEEVFVVTDGAVTLATLSGTDRAESGDAVRFAPGEVQSVRNDDDRPATVLALGAPADGTDVRIPLACPDCGHDWRRPGLAEDTAVLECPRCEHETRATCPACDSASVRAVLGEDGEPVGACARCGAVADH